MAQQVMVTLTDDMDGSNANETLSFAIDGISYEIDLNEPHAEALRAAVDPYIVAGRRVSSGKTSNRSKGSVPRQQRTQLGGSPEAIRAWAESQPDIELKSRGRIPGWVVERFNAAVL